jgi:putative membrane protein
MHMYFNDGYFMGGMHGFWWIFWVALIGVLVFYQWGRPGERRRGPRETPHEVLRRRLANGEITTEQYEERKTLLDRDSGESD